MDAEETLLTAENLAPNTKIVEDQASWQEIVEFLGGSKAKAQLLGAEIITNHDQYVRDVDQLRQRLRETYRGLLLPRGLFVQTWDMVTGICLLYTLFVTTYEVGLDLPTTFDGARPGRSPLLDFFGGEDPLPDLRAVGAAVRAWVRHSNEPVA